MICSISRRFAKVVKLVFLFILLILFCFIIWYKERRPQVLSRGECNVCHHERDFIKSCILNHTNTSEAILDDPTTSQYAVLEYMTEKDTFRALPDHKILYVERYIELLIMHTVSGKPHLILPDYVASRDDDHIIEMMTLSK